MKPILVTSLTRRHWDGSGKIRPSLAEYAMGTKAVAVELGVPLVDLHALSIAHANATGVDEYEKYEPRTDKGIDHTHLNLSGSRVIGKLVAKELVRVTPALARYFSLQSDERPAVSWVNPMLPDGPGLKHHVLASKAMGHDVGYVVSTLVGYDASGKTRYPVIYFLHGMGAMSRPMRVGSPAWCVALSELEKCRQRFASFQMVDAVATVVMWRR